MLLKILAIGFIGRNSYLADYWNWLDACVVVIGLLGLLPGFKRGTAIRCLRVLRPLRTISMLPRLRMLVLTIVRSTPSIANIVVLVALLIYIYAVLSVQFWHGDLQQRCYRFVAAANSSASTLQLERDTSLPCTMEQHCNWYGCGRRCEPGWTCEIHRNLFSRKLPTYDSTPSALVMAFKITNLDNWQSEAQLVRAASVPVALLFFVSLTFLGSFLCINLVISALTRNFSRLSRRYRQKLLQQQDTARGVFQNAKVVLPPEEYILQDEVAQVPALGDEHPSIEFLLRFMRRVRRVADSRVLNVFVVLFTLVNFIALLLVHYPMPAAMVRDIDRINIVCAVVFLAEAVLKIVAYRLKYFKDWGNLLDFCLVVLSIPQMASASDSTIVLSAMRVLRALRLLRHLRKWSALQHVCEAMAESVMEMIYLSAFALLIVWISALLGTQLLYDAFPNDFRWTFNSFWEGLLLSFVVLTGEVWGDAMEQSVKHTGNYGLALYFIGIVTFRYMVVNMPVAILLEHLRETRGAAKRVVNVDTVHQVQAVLMAEKSATGFRFYDEAEEEERVATKTVAVLQVPRTRRERVAAALASRPCFIVLQLILFANCVELAVDYSVSDYVGLRWANAAFALLFTIELILRLYAAGLKDFWRDLFNAVDAIVVFLVLLSVGVPALRVARSFRAFRMVEAAPGPRRLLLQVVQALPSVLGVLVLLLFFFLVFAVMGVYLFGGKMWNCVVCDGVRCGRTAQSGSYCTRATCEGAGYIWQAASHAYRNVGEALLSLFVLAVGEEWGTLMLDGIDAGAVDTCLRRRQTPANSLYFIAFVLLTNFFGVRVIIAVLIDQVTRASQQAGDYRCLSDAQESWLAAARVMTYNHHLPRRQLVPQSQCRLFFFDLTRKPWFEYLSVGCIMANSLFLGLHYLGESSGYDNMITVFNYIFLVIFTVEASIRWAGSGQHYLSEGWNVFDLLVLALSWLACLLDLILQDAPSLNVMRLLRVARILRIVPRLHQLRLFFSTVLHALPALLNVSFLLATLIFIFSAVGVELFHNVARDDTLTDLTNFETMYGAAYVLYIISTGEFWTEVLASTRKQPPLCSYAAGNCGLKTAPIFFVVFVFLCNIIVINLTICVIMAKFEERDILVDTRLAGLPGFDRDWALIDTDRQGKIHLKSFKILFRALPRPLGARTPMDMPLVSTMPDLAALELPVSRTGEVRYSDVLLALLRRVYGVSYVDCCVAQHLTKTDFGDGARSIFVPYWCVHHVTAATVVARRIRVWLAQRGARALRGPITPASSASPTWHTDAEEPYCHSERKKRRAYNTPNDWVPSSSDSESPDSASFHSVNPAIELICPNWQESERTGQATQAVQLYVHR
eukprot:TRINITY_DN8110_c0_g1_i1.p1 TRINITY_DN8110_c0_g1~~TRINITY_DN8110_c0_g1_i1.p1  ORF type:complete len:1449 (+),score=227.30 TRINITY_DN8110_c0_g1_i1:266-4348(+)